MKKINKWKNLGEKLNFESILLDLDEYSKKLVNRTNKEIDHLSHCAKLRIALLESEQLQLLDARIFNDLDRMANTGKS